MLISNQFTHQASNSTLIIGHGLEITSYRKSRGLIIYPCPSVTSLASSFHTLPQFSIMRLIKWPPFCRRHFQIHFFVRALLHVMSNFTTICLEGPVDDESTSVQIKAWHRTGDKLSIVEPKVVLFNDTYPSIYASFGPDELTHWGRNKMAATVQTTVSNACFGWKFFNFD